LSRRLPQMRVSMQPDPSLVALLQRDMRAKAEVTTKIAQARDQFRALELKAQSLGR
jgi:hypothetical protein